MAEEHKALGIVKPNTGTTQEGKVKPNTGTPSDLAKPNTGASPSHESTKTINKDVHNLADGKKDSKTDHEHLESAEIFSNQEEEEDSLKNDWISLSEEVSTRQAIWFKEHDQTNNDSSPKEEIQKDDSILEVSSSSHQEEIHSLSEDMNTPERSRIEKLPSGLSRAESMRRIREERSKLYNSRKKIQFREEEAEDIQLGPKKTQRASTKKGKTLLRAAEVSNHLVQDRSSQLTIIGADVEALYPSLEGVQVAEIVYRAIMETRVKFKGINYQEGCRYIALTSTAQECRLGPLRRVLPTRRHKSGTRPGVTGAGPTGATSGDQEQWEFPPVELTELEKRMIVARVMYTAVMALFNKHTYTFGGKYYFQKQGGPIGLRSTCCLARIVMIWWDRQLAEVMKENNLTAEEKARYMDDIRLWMWSVRLGWRWNGNELVFCEQWRNEERRLGMSGLEKTLEIMKGIMNSICNFLKLTMESALDFDGVLPTLDLVIWVDENNKVMFKFYQKPMASNMVLQKESAMPQNMKIASLNQEVIRRMLNTSEDLDVSVRVGVVDDYAQKLTNSGFKLDQTRSIIVGGLTGYERKLALSKDKSNPKWKPLHQPAGHNIQARRRQKLLGKSNWFKRKREDEGETGSKKQKLVSSHEDQDSSPEEGNEHQDDPSHLKSSQTINVESSLTINVEEPDGGRSSVHAQTGSLCSMSSMSNIVYDQSKAEKKNNPKHHVKNKSDKRGNKRKYAEDIKVDTNRIHLKPNGGPRIDPPTIGVMFVDQTLGGVLAKRLQEAEDRIAKVTGYRIRMVESAGTQLRRLLPNTNPWAGSDCGREKCYTCNQGGEKREDCKRRNILYESACTICNPDDGGKKRKLNDVQGVYVGESARSIFERAQEHWADRVSQKEDSHMVKHWLSDHADLQEPPPFKIKVISSFRDPMTRQISESVRIDLRGGGVLNSKTEYSRCRLPRLTVDVEEWRSKKKEERKELETISEEGMEWMQEEWNGEKVDDKRKPEAVTLPSNKRRKLTILNNWGEKMDNPTPCVRTWLSQGMIPEEESDSDWQLKTPSSNQIPSKKLKQLELSFGQSTIKQASSGTKWAVGKIRTSKISQKEMVNLATQNTKIAWIPESSAKPREMEVSKVAGGMVKPNTGTTPGERVKPNTGTPPGPAKPNTGAGPSHLKSSQTINVESSLTINVERPDGGRSSVHAQTGSLCSMSSMSNIVYGLDAQWRKDPHLPEEFSRAYEDNAHYQLEQLELRLNKMHNQKERTTQKLEGAGGWPEDDDWLEEGGLEMSWNFERWVEHEMTEIYFPMDVPLPTAKHFTRTSVCNKTHTAHLPGRGKNENENENENVERGTDTLTTQNVTLPNVRLVQEGVAIELCQAQDIKTNNIQKVTIYSVEDTHDILSICSDEDTHDILSICSDEDTHDILSICSEEDTHDILSGTAAINNHQDTVQNHQNGRPAQDKPGEGDGEEYGGAYGHGPGEHGQGGGGGDGGDRDDKEPTWSNIQTFGDITHSREEQSNIQRGGGDGQGGQDKPDDEPGGGDGQGVGGDHHVKLSKGPARWKKLNIRRGVNPDGLVQTRIQGFIKKFPNLEGEVGGCNCNESDRKTKTASCQHSKSFGGKRQMEVLEIESSEGSPMKKMKR